MIDTKGLLQAYDIPFSRRKQWILVNCPHCDDYGMNGAFHSQRKIFTCFKCGGNPFAKSLKMVANLSDNEYASAMALYSDGTEDYPVEVRERIKDIDVVLPFGSKPLLEIHKKYLSDRGFNPDELAEKYDLLGTNHLSDIPMRIIIPIYYQGILCSYTSRSVNGNADRYISCDSEYEKISHKDLLYNYDMAGDTIIICEGPFDALKIGDGAVCTFGLAFTDYQIELMRQKKKRYILFDNEPKAQLQADVLAKSLSYIKGTTEIIRYDGNKDPGEFSTEEVKQVRDYVFG